MNEPSDADPAQTDPVLTPADNDAPAKPARRKRTVKAAADTLPDTAAIEAAPQAEEAAAKPKPARKRAAKPVANPEAEASACAAAMPVEAPAGGPPNPFAVADLAASAHSLPLMPGTIEGGNAGIDRTSDEGAQPSGGGSEAAAYAESPPSGEGRSGRRRDRRRNRRGGNATEASGPDFERGETGEAGESDVEDDIPREPPIEAGELFAQVLSGEFDVAGEPPAEGEPPVLHKRVLRAEPEAPKLHKVLAQAGVGSRRDMEQFIADGHVTVNGQPAHVGQRISFGDQIKVNGKPVRVRIVPPPPRIVAYHKPAGEIVTHDDPQHRPTVFRRLPRLPQGKWQSVGRLDINTEGLLLFTNSGELANQLMHPRFGVEREYAVRVLGTLDDEARAQLIEGVTIDGQVAGFRSIEDGGGDGANHWYRVVITEGRNREVRKLFDAVGLTVSRLIRIRYGTVVLPRGLKRGVWIDLDEADVRAIRRLANPNGDSQERGGRPNKRDRGDRSGRGHNGPRPQRQPDAARAAPPDGAPFDDELEDDFDPSRIPNPLEQTFDKRFVQNPRSSVGGRGFRSGGGGFGSGGSGQPQRNHNNNKKGGPREPDPLQTSVGYIGADAFHRKGNRGGGGGRGGGGFGGGGGGGSGPNRGGRRGGR